MERTNKRIVPFENAIAEAVKFCEATNVSYRTGLACRNDKKELVFSVDVLGGQEILYNLENERIVIENTGKISEIEKALSSIKPKISLKDVALNESYRRYKREVEFDTERLDWNKEELAKIENWGWLYKLLDSNKRLEKRKTDCLININDRENKIREKEAKMNIIAKDYINFGVRQIAEKHGLKGDLSFSMITAHGLYPSLKDLIGLCEIGKINENEMELFTTKYGWPVIVETW